MKHVLPFLLLILLPACGPKPTEPKPAATTPSSAPATPKPTPLPIATPAAAAQVQQIFTSPSLNLRVNEELMLIGDVLLSDGKKLSFDQVMSLIQLKNQSPELLLVDPTTRLMRALKAGTAVLAISAKNQTNIQMLVTVRIADGDAGIDPNIALVDVEVE
ncbi:MAG: hypothetical protein CVV27_13015 [Candidatus Melainabacteria bacterium HGW-Melainabacteria-1]|nr:MAG: hypothetical protein CVV27_13015 [Candidatus Melainabacteria bacterium HGW-Melainabacteria-1]